MDVGYTFYWALSSIYTEPDASHLESDVLTFFTEIRRSRVSAKTVISQSPALFTHLQIYSERKEGRRNVSYTTEFPSIPRIMFSVSTFFFACCCVVSFWDSLEGVIDFQTVGGQARERFLFIGQCRCNYFSRLVFSSLQGLSVSRLCCRRFLSIQFQYFLPPILYILGKFLHALDQLFLPSFWSIPFTERPTLRIKYPVTEKRSFDRMQSFDF